MFTKTISRTIMEVKERRPYSSLSKSRRHKEGPYTGETLGPLSFVFLFPANWHVKLAASRFWLTLHNVLTASTDLRRAAYPFVGALPLFTCMYVHLISLNQVYRGTVKTRRGSASRLRSHTPPVKHSRPSTSIRTRPGWTWEYERGGYLT